MESNKVTETIRADDFVEYFLFPSLDELPGTSEEEKLDRFLQEINGHVNIFTKDFIWHKEPFQLIARSGDTSKLLNENEQGGM